jgi:hypothetical protein
VKTFKTFTFLFIAAIAFGNWRCSSNFDYSKELSQIDSLYASAETLKQNMLSIDSVDVMEKAQIVNADFIFVQDSLPAELLMKSDFFLNQLKTVKKMTGGFSIEFHTLKTEAQYSIDQLNDLKSDLGNGSLSPEDAKKYIMDETKALAILNQHYQKLKQALNILNEQYFVNQSSFYNLYHEYYNSL